MPANPRGTDNFPTTHWSELGRAAAETQATESELLGHLLSQYLPPLKHFLVRVQGYSADHAEDLLQGFILDRVIRGGLLGKADQQRGKFRTLLITALKNYASNTHARSRRPGPTQSLSSKHNTVPCNSDESTGIFEVAWAKQLVSAALKQMEQECQASNRMHIWTVFFLRVVHPAFNNTKPPSYKELVEQFGFDSPTQACNVVITGKRMYSRILRGMVKEYVRDSEFVDDELKDLWKILTATHA
ncbi:sigma-70 family RNA polymerase sigma factor [Planctomycetales bacterium ZRK34]|nr:sigma-70 family RNA polymerase sigma factor [Planctomycetales bacterium ZRK34]